MRHRTTAHLAAAWAILFAAPPVYWATGRNDGLGTALSNRVVDHASAAMAIGCAGIALFCLARAQVADGQPSAVNRLLVLNAEPYPGRGTVLLLRQAIGFRHHQE